MISDELASYTSSHSQMMDINIDTKVFSMLYEGIYSDPYRAIVREVISNGIDASVRANTKEPIILSLPQTINEEISFQDFGTGMSIEKVLEVFASFLSTDKNNDGTQIGGFGLGGKTPYMYADVFKIETTSPDDNVRRTFICSKVNNQPAIDHIAELDVANSKIIGTKISFNIKDTEDVYKFINGFEDMIYSSYPIDIKFDQLSKDSVLKIIGVDPIITKEVIEQLNDVHYYFNSNYCFNNKQKIKKIPLFNKNDDDKPYNINIRLGGITYTYNTTSDILINNAHDIIKYALVLENLLTGDYINDRYIFDSIACIIDYNNNGEIELSTSREEIVKSEKNDLTIKKLLLKRANDFLCNIVQKIINCIDDLNFNYSGLRKILEIETIINYVVKHDKTINKGVSSSLYSTHSKIIESMLKFKQHFSEPVDLIYKNKISFAKKDESFIFRFFNDFDKRLEKETYNFRKKNIVLNDYISEEHYNLPILDETLSTISIFNLFRLMYKRANQSNYLVISSFLDLIKFLNLVIDNIVMLNIDVNENLIKKSDFPALNFAIKQKHTNSQNELTPFVYVVYVKKPNVEDFYVFSNEIKELNIDTSVKKTRNREVLVENLSLNKELFRSMFIKVEIIDNYKHILGLIEKDPFLIILPKTIDITTSDSKIEIIFKRYFYNKDPNPKTIKLFKPLTNIPNLKFQLVTREVYEELLNNNKISGLFFKTIYNNFFTLLSKLIDVLTLDCKNYDIYLKVKDRMINSLEDDCLDLLNKNVKNKITNKIACDIMNFLPFENYYRNKIDKDVLNTLNKFKKTKQYINTTNIDIPHDALFRRKSHQINRLCFILAKIHNAGDNISINTLDQILLEKETQDYLDDVKEAFYIANKHINEVNEYIEFSLEQYKNTISKTNKGNLFDNPLLDLISEID